MIVVRDVKSRIYSSDVKDFYESVYVPIAKSSGTGSTTFTVRVIQRALWRS
ncbi:MAG: hypothetical protein QXE75_04835 [Sulfolobales archaeon]